MTDDPGPARGRLAARLWDLNDDLVAAPTQEAVVERLADGLAAAPQFDAAWVCERPTGFAPRATAGVERGRVERLYGDRDGDPPWTLAADDRDPVVRSLEADGGGLLVACVPLRHRGIVHGVAVVAREGDGPGGASGEGDADSGTDRAALSALLAPLDSLGRAAGHALATAEMQAQSETFQGAIEQAEPAIAILDEEGVVEYVNAAFTTVYGYAKSEAVGSSLALLLPADVDADELLASVREGETWREDVTQQRRGGGRFHVDLSVAPVMVEGGTRWKYVAVASDITARKEREQRLQVLSRVLRHNVRNSLAVVRGHVEAAADRADAPVGSLLSTALSTADDLLATATTAREVQAALEDASVREQELTDAAAWAAERAHEEYPGTTVSVATPEAAPVVAMDALPEALWELVQNACEHGDGPVEVRVARDDDGATAVVADEGPGIPDHELATIERGEETALEHGSGLGLWFVHWVVDGSGGSLSCTTDEGTTVRVELPGADG